MLRVNHIVKILPDYFDLIESGAMTFQVRRNDRGYKEGQIITFTEWDGEAHTGKAKTFKIGHVSNIMQESANVVFSLLPLPVEGGAA